MIVIFCPDVQDARIPELEGGQNTHQRTEKFSSEARHQPSSIIHQRHACTRLSLTAVMSSHTPSILICSLYRVLSPPPASSAIVAPTILTSSTLTTMVVMLSPV